MAEKTIKTKKEITPKVATKVSTPKEPKEIEAKKVSKEGEEDFSLNEAIEEGLKKKGKGGKEKYFEAVGRRKSAVARVRLFTKINGITINEKPLAKYFPTLRLQSEVMSPLEKMKLSDKLGATIKVSGGGITSQAESARLGIARALIVFNPIFKKRLRRLGFVTRDARVVERKKYGLKKARRAPQWSKR